MDINKNPEIPADRGLSGLSSGISKKYGAPVFETLAVLEAANREAASGVALPSEDSVLRAKKWVDENRL